MRGMERRGAAPRVFALHKPRGVVVSTVHERNAPIALDLLPAPYRTWFAVGRLDRDSEGLLLFCNDARVAQRLMDPGGVPKVYLVTVRGLPDEGDLEPLRRGDGSLDGRPLRPIEARLLGKAPRGGTRLEVVLHEGRNRQIRRVFARLGLKVRRLVRTTIGPVGLEDLAPGDGRELSHREVAALIASLPA